MSGYCTTEALFFEFRLSHKFLWACELLIASS
jgi:hypothetical protein